MSKKIIYSLKFFVLILCFIAEFNEVFSENTLDQQGEAIEIKTVTNPRFRSGFHSVTFSSEGKNYNLNFVQRERNVFTSNTPVWISETNPENPLKNNYRPLKQMEKKVEGNIYVDHNNSAVFLIRYDTEKRKYFYDGVFGEKNQRRVIRSRGDKSDFLRNGNSADHMIFRSSTIKDGVDLPTPFSDLVRLEREGEVLEKVDKPLETLYPKVIAVVDHTIFELLEGDIIDTIKYAVVFWNVVDQVYAKIAHPKVEISLAGVLIATNERSLDFIYNSRNFPDDGHSINIIRYGYNSANYFYRDFSEDLKFDDYDAAVIMTNLDLQHPEIQSILFGIANSIGYICRRGLNVAIGIDDGKYVGTLTIVHELGHLLNMFHDDYNHSFNHCDPVLEDDQHKPVSQSVMAWEKGLPVHWSECSIQSIERLASYKAGQCLGRRLTRD